jgi:hypothetical protein
MDFRWSWKRVRGVGTGLLVSFYDYVTTDEKCKRERYLVLWLYGHATRALRKNFIGTGLAKPI